MAKFQPMRVNHSTKPEDIIATMREEIPTEYYFFRKQFGGRQKYYKYEDQMLDKAIEEKEDQYTDIHSHISKAGNRWMVYTQAQYFPKAIYAQAFQFSFIYYETMASCGAFFPIFDPVEYKKKGKDRRRHEAKPTGVIIFTAHFFYQMSERTGKAYRSKELIKEFISTKCEHAIQADEDGEVLIKFKGGYGFGVQLSENPRVFEIRTFLKDTQLNGKQHRKVEPLDAMYELGRDGTFMSEVAMHTAINQYDENKEQLIKDSVKKFEALKKLGLEKRLVLHSLCYILFLKIIKRLLTEDITPQQEIIISHFVGNHSKKFMEKYDQKDVQTLTVKGNAELYSDILDVLTAAAREMKLRSLTRERMAAAMNQIILEIEEEQKELN